MGRFTKGCKPCYERSEWEHGFPVVRYMRQVYVRLQRGGKNVLVPIGWKCFACGHVEWFDVSNLHLETTVFPRKQR